jgi:hypothetical protein
VSRQQSRVNDHAALDRRPAGDQRAALGVAPRSQDDWRTAALLRRLERSVVSWMAENSAR